VSRPSRRVCGFRTALPDDLPARRLPRCRGRGRQHDRARAAERVDDITFGDDGTLYVTELFDGRVMRIPTTRSHAGLVAGTPSVLAEVPLPNGLATAPDGTISASILSLTAEGQVVPLGR
jgi:hypothetical protein